MKRVIGNLYGVKGGVSGERINELRTLLGLGTTSNSAEFVEHALATAANDFVVASGSGVFVKKTQAETKAILFDGGIAVAGTTVTGFTVGACTTGFSVTGTCTTGVSITGAATDAFKCATGAFTNGINISGSAVTNAINIPAAANVTNFVKFNAWAGCLLRMDVNPKDIPSGGGLGADGCIQIDIGGSDFYIPIFAVSLS
jgi:hypothetical protein